MKVREPILCSVVAAVVLLLVGVAFHWGVKAWAPHILAQFDNLPLYRDWDGWTWIYMLVHPLWFGPVFAAMFLILRARCQLPTSWRGGLAFGVGLFLVGSMPVFLLAFASFQMSPEMLVLWLAQNLCQYSAAGAVIGALDQWQSARIVK
ncbi:MAG: hypothetical protein MUF06_04880 [Pirellulaceae bacterium]|jgi:hypothetical protein|nr:hypothetical protein [Pirellulaceae bacterium]